MWNLQQYFFENGTNWQFITTWYVNFTPDFTLINELSQAFDSLKPMRFQGLHPWTPARRMRSSMDSEWYENLLWNYIKLQFNIITNTLRHIILKSMKVRTWSKGRLERLEWSCEFYPPELVSLDYWSGKTHELPGAPPSGPPSGVMPMTPPGDLRTSICSSNLNNTGTIT